MSAQRILKVGDYVAMKANCRTNDWRRLCGFPIGEIMQIRDNGTLVIRRAGDRSDETDEYKPEEVTYFFLVEVYDENETWYAEVIEDEERYDVIFLRDIDTGRRSMFHMDAFGEGILEVIIDPPRYFEHLRRRRKHYESLPNLTSMLLASKQGTMEHLPIPENTKGKIMSYLSGYNVGTGKEKNHLKILQEYLTRSGYENVGGVGVNTRYGKPVPRRTAFNKALNEGPLPHGPTEENFMGGSLGQRGGKRSGPKQKSLRKIGTQMARRGTRRSKGIFSRLYSPIGHLLAAGKESVGAVTNTAKGVVGEGIHGLDKIGRSVTKHANMAVKDVFTRKGGKRKARGTRKSRKSRRSTRRRR